MQTGAILLHLGELVDRYAAVGGGGMLRNMQRCTIMDIIPIRNWGGGRGGEGGRCITALFWHKTSPVGMLRIRSTQTKMGHAQINNLLQNLLESYAQLSPP